MFSEDSSGWQIITIIIATAKECNCRRKENCPLSGKCETTGIVYQATVKREDSREEKNYVGLTEGPFKTRFNNHTSSFRNPQHKHATELSTYQMENN